MRLSPATEELVGEMITWQRNFQENSYGREDSSVHPFILVIGSGCARAARIPSHSEIARRLFDDLFKLDPETATQYLSEEDRANEDKLVEALFAMLRDLTTVERRSLLQTFYDRIPIPLFYQDLARVIKSGYFSHVLTTNIDTLLEQALGGAGQGSDPLRRAPYQVTTFGLETGRDTHYSSTTGDTPSIIKVPGDSSAVGLSISDEEIEAALNISSRGFVRVQGSAVVVVVGYEFESHPVNSWLAHTTGGVLWWVNPEPPDPQLIHPIENTWEVRHISAEPDTFFDALAVGLLRLPLQRSAAKPLKGHRGSAIHSNLENLDDDRRVRETLLDKIRRCRAELQSLTQTIALGQKDPQMMAQIDYQRHQLVILEDRLRNLSSSRSQIPDLFDRITDIAEKAGIDSSTLSYLQTQANAVKNEYRKDKPNQHIVSGSIGATVLIAERLGAEIVDSQAVSTLASFAPEPLTKGV